MVAARPLVEMRGIRKSFGSVEVLHGVDFTVVPGEVHVLAGENGAGKSTLMKILSGVYEGFEGELTVAGGSRHFSHPSEAVAAGITMIHQELSLVPTLSLSDNLFLGNERTGSLGQVDFSEQAREAEAILETTGIHVLPEDLVEDLPIAAQQTLEIARALARDASIVIFDEPTSALGEGEVEDLFQRIQELRDQGKGIVYISHKMEEIFLVADRITVLRDGALVRTAEAATLTPEELVSLMVGRDLEAVGHGRAEPMEEGVLDVAGLRVTHPRVPSRFVVDGVDFALKKGEILGLAGLQGSGKSEVLHALFGTLEGRASGEAALFGSPLPLRDPRESIQRGLVLLTNDRKSLGLAPEMSVTHSVSLSSLGRFSNRIGWMHERKELAAVSERTKGFSLAAPSMESPIRTLSGGNQQKAYLARCLLADPAVLLLDEPTRGIDVGAKTDIYRLIEEWTGMGIAILLITSEMDELLALSHRILVMHRGRIEAEFARESASKEAVLSAAMGHGAQKQPTESKETG